MIKFNADNIFVGHIKTLLHDFNLPKAKVVTENTPLREGCFYIKDNNICVGEKNKKNNDTVECKVICPYSVKQKSFSTDKTNKEFRNYNLVRNLVINNLIYDSYTHKYLGDYLRFVRDYYKLDLMSLYNCFSNEMPSNLNVEVGASKFNSDDTDYRIYMVPVRFNSEYTIAIESSFPVEMFCGYYKKGYYTLNKGYQQLTKDTLYKVRDCRFARPFIYNKLINKDLIESLTSLDFKNECNLYLFIKVKNSVKSSIAVLEGNYSNYNDYNFGTYKTTAKRNYCVNNYEYYLKDKKSLNKKFISKLQLLEFNSETSHPFADRLIEYLVDNPVTNRETISDNITRVQTKLHNKGLYKHFSDYGIWTDVCRNVLYDVAHNENLINTKCDVMGFLDKDVENKLGEDEDIYGGDF